MRRQLKWNMQDLCWKQSCRWGYTFGGALGLTDSTFLMEENMDNSMAKNHRRIRLTAQSSFTHALTSSTKHSDDFYAEQIAKLSSEHETASYALSTLFREYKHRKQQKPTIELNFELAEASLVLRCHSSDILKVACSNLYVAMTQFEDQSGSFSCKLRQFTCENLLPGKH